MKQSANYQCRTSRDHLRVVHLDTNHGRSADRRLAQYGPRIVLGPFEVRTPGLFARIEQASRPAGNRIERTDAIKLVGIASRARESQVGEDCWTAQTNRADVIDDENRQLVPRRETTVLTAEPCSGRNSGAERARNPTHRRATSGNTSHRYCSASWASSFSFVRFCQKSTRIDSSARSALVNESLSSASSRRRFTKARPNLYLARRRSVFAQVRTARLSCCPFDTAVGMNGTPCIQTSTRGDSDHHRSVAVFAPQSGSPRSNR